MNLNFNPTQEQLRELLASCDDEAGHHVLWVAKDGGVNIDLLPAPLSPVAFANKLGARLKFRHETFEAGNGYVGEQAAKDNQWVHELFSALQADWARNSRGYVDA